MYTDMSVRQMLIGAVTGNLAGAAVRPSAAPASETGTAVENLDSPRGHWDPTGGSGNASKRKVRRCEVAPRITAAMGTLVPSNRPVPEKKTKKTGGGEQHTPDA